MVIHISFQYGWDCSNDNTLGKDRMAIIQKINQQNKCQSQKIICTCQDNNPPIKSTQVCGLTATPRTFKLFTKAYRKNIYFGELILFSVCMHGYHSPSLRRREHPFHWQHISGAIHTTLQHTDCYRSTLKVSIQNNTAHMLPTELKISHIYLNWHRTRASNSILNINQWYIRGTTKPFEQISLN